MHNSVSRAAEAHKVTLTGSAINLVLIIIKIVSGILGRSSAMIADAAHSMSDFATDIVVLVGISVAKKPRDESHKYGHGKFETLASLIIAISLVIVGVGIAFNSIKTIIDFYSGVKLARPGVIALAAALISIVTKEILYRVTVRAAVKIKSNALRANAWHHRSDALSSIGAFFGIGGAIVFGENWTILDPVAGAVVAILIIKTGFDIAKESISELLESSVSIEEEKKILAIIESVGGVNDPHNLRTRKIGNTMAVDIHIRVSPEMTVRESHVIASRVENDIRNEYGDETIISVHVEPEF